MTDPPTALRALLDLVRSLAEERPLEQTLEVVSDTCLALLPGDHASVRLLDESGRELLSGARSGAGADSPPAPFRKGDGVLGWVAQFGLPARVDDVLADDRFQETGGQGFEVRSVVAAPLPSGGNVVGVLSASSPRPGAFDDDALALLVLIARAAAPAIEAARQARLEAADVPTLAYDGRFLLPRVEEEMARAKRQVAPLSLLYMNLDHFRHVNDEYGRAAGDRILRAFADCVRGIVRRGDVLFRRAGDEFVLVMPGTGEGDACLVAERVRASVIDPDPASSSRDVFVPQTVSIGVAQWDTVEEAASLEDRAKDAMRHAKSRGRDQAVVAPPPGERLSVP